MSNFNSLRMRVTTKISNKVSLIFSPAYQPLLNTIIANCETLYNSTAAETIQSSNTPDDEIVSSPRKPSQESELTSDSEKITEGEKEEKNVNEEEESSECSIM